MHDKDHRIADHDAVYQDVGEQRSMLSGRVAEVDDYMDMVEEREGGDDEEQDGGDDRPMELCERY